MNKSNYLDYLLKTNYFMVLIIPLFYSTEFLDSSGLHRLLFSLFTFTLSSLIFFNMSIFTINFNKKFVWFSILFPVLLTLSSVFNNSLALLLPDLFLILNYFIFSFLVIILFNYWDENYFIAFTSKIIFIVAGCVALIGILQAYNFSLPNLPLLKPPGSTLLSRNFAAEYIAGVIPWCVISLFHTSLKKNYSYILSLIGMFILISYLFILRGRAGYLAFFVSVIIFGLFYFRQYFFQKSLYIHKRPILSLIIIILLAITFSFFEPPNVESGRQKLSSTLMSISNPHNKSNSSRFSQWKSSLEMASHSPFWGIGIAKWAGEYPKYRGKQYNDLSVYRNFNLNPHNDILEFFSENGLFVVLLYIWFCITAILLLHKKAPKNIFYLLIFISFISIFIVSLFSFTKDRPATMSIFFLNAGIAFVIVSQYKTIGSRFLK